MANAIHAVSPTTIKTYHPESEGSGRWFHDEAWLSVNSCQSGHGAVRQGESRLAPLASGCQFPSLVIDTSSRNP